MTIKFNIPINKSHTLFRFLNEGLDVSYWVQKIEYNEILNELMVWADMYKDNEELESLIIEWTEFESTTDLNELSIAYKDGSLKQLTTK